MLAMLGINILFYCFSPQYVTYGSQHYINENATAANETVAICSTEALEGETDLCLTIWINCSDLFDCSDQCTMTRVSSLLVRFFYKVWFFGAFYYWSMWAFIAVSINKDVN